jgi:ubiquinol-cytochrome c reductase iron-sulfur subunit
MKRDPDDAVRRKALVRLTAAVGGVAAAGAAVPFVASLAPSERAKAAGAPVEVDLGGLKPAELRTVEWRGRPVWLLRRTPDMLERLVSAERYLIDPRSEESSQQPEYARNATRSIEPDLLVTVALCPTRCSPAGRAGSTARATDRSSTSRAASIAARPHPRISSFRRTAMGPRPGWSWERTTRPSSERSAPCKPRM